MGKHERDIVEEAERITAALISKRSLTLVQKRHPFLGVIKEFVFVINTEYGDIKSAEAIGNEYDSRGDIRLTLAGDREKFIELKFLEDGGNGTLANISQDALTSLGIYRCESWSDFRMRTGHRKKVIKSLNRFPYPSGAIVESDADKRIYEAASYLKQVVRAGTRTVENVCQELLDYPRCSQRQRLAASLILEIIKMDRESRLAYLSILRKSELNKDRLKKFAFLLLTGNHTQEILSGEMERDFALLSDNIDDYDIYYLYKKSLTVVKENHTLKLLEIFDTDICVDIKNDETSLIVCTLNNDGGRKGLIRVAYHWKNKFQGIQTPCLNIFGL